MANNETLNGLSGMITMSLENGFTLDPTPEELKLVIKDLLEFITVPDEPVYSTAVYIPAEQTLVNQANIIIKLKQVVAKARQIVK